MRRRGWWIAAGCIGVPVFIGAWAFLYPSPAPFPFLEGKPLFGKPHVVPDNIGGGPPSYEIDYAFEADWDRFMAIVDGTLRPKNWRRDDISDDFTPIYSEDGTTEKTTATMYSHDGTSICFYRNSTPEIMLTSDIVCVGTYQKGSVGVAYYKKDYKPPFPIRLRNWIRRIFDRQVESEGSESEEPRSEG